MVYGMSEGKRAALLLPEVLARGLSSWFGGYYRSLRALVSGVNGTKVTVDSEYRDNRKSPFIFENRN